MRLFPAFAFSWLLVSASMRAESLLILPFFNQTNNSNLDWIGESVAETIRDTLAAEGVTTVPRDDRAEVYRRLAIRPYAQLTKATVLKIGESLDADNVVYGGFTLVGEPSTGNSRGTLRINAQILDLRKIQAGKKFEELGAMEDLAALQSHLTWQLLQTVRSRQAITEDEFRSRRTLVRLDALEFYIRGLLAATGEQKHYFFTQAARVDPKFSQPCFEVGKLLFDKEDFRGAADWLDRVAKSATHYREATFLRGVARFYLGEYPASQAAFETVMAEVPLNEVQNNLAAAQSRRNLADAVDNFRKAQEGDPGDPDYLFNLGYALWRRGEFEAAAERFRDALKRDPEDTEATFLLGRCLQRSGPRPGDPKTENLERLKHDYNESAFLQLRSILEGAKGASKK
ncbi:MAG: tetratricopeptide repeat protein [Acidobacteria bacterium]|nr:tetratricopeptide repeat protein [Acidobacteriota bacterium]